MSNPNVILIQSLYAAFLNGQIDTIIAALTPDVDWQTVGRTKDYPLFGPRKGIAAVQEFFRLVAASEEFSQFSPREFYSVGDKVFALGSCAGTIRKTGRPFATEWVHVFTVKGGKVSQFREHTDTAQVAEGFRRR
jgi:uncharacterized protein